MPKEPAYDIEGWSTVRLSQGYAQIERLTVPLALKLLKRLQDDDDLSISDVELFDNGCGTGAMTVVLKKYFPNLQIHSTDASSGMIETLNTRVKHDGWKYITTGVADSRPPDNRFGYVFSTFVICLAHEPDLIALEMYRVTRPGGILCLAVWADLGFGYFNNPWTKACKQLDSKYQQQRIVDDSWTAAEQLNAGLKKAGFKDVHLTTEKGLWQWESYDELTKYFLEGGNPGNERMLDAWRALGRNVEEVKPLHKQIVEEDYPLHRQRAPL